MSSSKPDIEKIVLDWAFRKFDQRASRKEKKLIRENMVHMEIDWKRVKFRHGEPEYKPKPHKPGTGTPKNNTLYETTFSNRTGHEQSYTFKAERRTMSSCNISLESGFTKGWETSVTLKSPCEILEANAGFKKEISITDTEEQTVEEEMTWGVDSEVKVDKDHRAHAKMVILEEEYDGKFEVLTTITGRVRVTFHNMKDANSYLDMKEGDIYLIVDEETSRGTLRGDALKVLKDKKAIQVTTRGKCLFKYGLKQDVEVRQTPLAPEPSEQ